MTHHDDLVRLHHMRDHAREAIDMAGDRSIGEIASNRLLVLAATRLVEIVGEAASRVSESTRQKTPNIPWTLIRGMRNRLIHGYDRVDIDVLWRTIHQDLPPLLHHLDTAIAELESGKNPPG